jgi:hypothetical protein
VVLEPGAEEAGQDLAVEAEALPRQHVPEGSGAALS